MCPKLELLTKYQLRVKYGKINKNGWLVMDMQIRLHMVTIEDLVPRDHFLRKLESALDLSFVRDETRKLYSHRYGRPAMDPVVLVKYLLVGYLYGIPSERQIERRIQTDMALRWYLGLDLFDAVPDHSTISQLRRRKPALRKVFRRLFEEVVHQCIAAGLASGRLVGTDSTHVKACASRASEELVEMPVEPGVYWERLDACEEDDLERLAEKLGHRRKKRTKQIKKDSRRSHRRVSHTTKVEFGRERFRYDGNNDCYVCPNGKSLNLHGVGRSASAVTWIYQAKCAGCQSCPDRDRCLSESHWKGGRKLERSVFHEVVQRDLKRREEPDYRDALRLRQIWCEGTFAAQKWGHNLARVLRRGLEAAEDHCLLSATALNLKRMIKCIG